jgi:hypothetical protein
MTTFKVREHPMAPKVRAKIEAHPVLEAFRKRFPDVEPEAAKKVLTDSVLDAMDLLAFRYVTRMSQVVGRLTRLREAIHVVYERVLSGSVEHLDTAALRRAFEELHATTKELADPKTWAEGEGKQVEPLPAAPPVEYPGSRAGLEKKPSVAPGKGDPVRGRPGKSWDVQTKHRGDITLEIDAEGLYWKFPELEEGVVLHFPEYGYRVWKEPGTGAIVEELIVGPSVSGARRFTRGEDVIFSAAEMGEAYRKGGTQRAHGAGAPGLGFDVGYGVAHALARINNWIENHGLEQWVRNLRDNAPPGVEYVWSTSTRKRGQKLAQRGYTISAIADGKLHELYAFELSVPEGPPDIDAPIDFDLVGITPEAELYGAPYTKESIAAHDAAPEGDKPPLERLEPPQALSEALGRTQKRGPVATAHPAIQRAGERIQALTRVIETTIFNRAMAAADPAWSEPIAELTDVVGRLDEQVRTSAPNPERTARIDTAITDFNRRARYARPDDLRALTRKLANILRGR